jgi:Rrf2 family protein
MKFSAQEEYGIRCLIRLAKEFNENRGLTIPEISQAEGVSTHTIGKILRELRLGGFVDAERGFTGGYTLTRSPEKIIMGDVFRSLGGKLYDDTFCQSHSGVASICTNSVDCSIRSLWTLIQKSVDNVINSMTLKDLMLSEEDVFSKISF